MLKIEFIFFSIALQNALALWAAKSSEDQPRASRS
jgi:hypothetical protein